jgi:hypothetical protein
MTWVRGSPEQADEQAALELDTPGPLCTRKLSTLKFRLTGKANFKKIARNFSSSRRTAGYVSILAEHSQFSSLKTPYRGQREIDRTVLAKNAGPATPRGQALKQPLCDPSTCSCDRAGGVYA